MEMSCSFFHGTPGSRLAFTDTDLIAQIPNIRLISPERPGYGLSDSKPDRTLLDWAADVEELANHFGINEFTITSESGGGPHALAVASAIPQRVEKVFLCCSPAPASFKGAKKGMAIGNRLGLIFKSIFTPVRRCNNEELCCWIFERPKTIYRCHDPPDASIGSGVHE